MGSQNGSRTIICDLGGLNRADAGTVDTLARLQLAARRAGVDLRFRHASGDLRCLLGLCGLEVALRLEAEREPEEREQRLRVEEERQLPDPPS